MNVISVLVIILCYWSYYTWRCYAYQKYLQSGKGQRLRML